MSNGATRPSAPADQAGAAPIAAEGTEAARPGAAPEPSSPHAAALPSSRTYDPPPPSGFRQAPKETWEPQQRPIRRPDFADRVARTTEVVLDPDALAPPKPPPRRTGAITWEDDQSAARRTEPDAEGGLSRGQRLVLASLSVLVVLLAVTWAIKSLGGSKLSGSLAAVAPAQPVPARAEPVPDSGLTEEVYREAVSQAKKFLAAQSLDDLMPVLRDPERVRPLMETFYRDGGWHPLVVRSVAPIEAFQTKGAMVAGVMEVGDFGRRALAFLRTPDGIKVDWECFVGFGEVPWDRLAAERPTRPVLMRVRLSPDDYYNFDFADPRTYACYRLVSHDGAHQIYGYARRDGTVFSRLLSRNRPNSFTMPTLRFRFKEGGVSSDQVEITEFVSDGWLVEDQDASSGAAPDSNRKAR